MTTIRSAAPGERAALEALQRRASLANDGDRDALLAHPDAIDLPVEHIERGCVWVADEGGRANGFAVIIPRDDGDMELDGLFVEPAGWRNGVGRALVKHCAIDARHRGAQRLHVLGNPHALDFYFACGFKKTGIAPTRFGDGVTMVLDLDSPAAITTAAIDRGNAA